MSKLSPREQKILALVEAQIRMEDPELAADLEPTPSVDDATMAHFERLLENPIDPRTTPDVLAWARREPVTLAACLALGVVLVLLALPASLPLSIVGGAVAAGSGVLLLVTGWQWLCHAMNRLLDDPHKVDQPG